MSKLEDLHTLVRLLAEFELPVSPILEYAIKNKEEELINISQEDSKIQPIHVPKKKVDLNGSSDVAEGVKTTKKNPSILRIYRADNSYIEELRAANSMCVAIKEIGVDKIYDLKIPMDGMHLVTKGGNPKYPTAQYDVGNGFFVNVHSNTLTKKRQLERIFKEFNLSWRVEIVES